jgi:hypothetical protein
MSERVNGVARGEDFRRLAEARGLRPRSGSCLSGLGAALLFLTMPESNVGAPIKFFEGLREGRFWSEPERVTLPSSRLRVSLCRPTTKFFRQLYAQWPAEVQEECAFRAMTGETADWIPERLDFIASECLSIIEEAFIQGTVILGSGRDAVDSANLDEKDLEFLIDYLMRQENGVSDDGGGRAGRIN